MASQSEIAAFLAGRLRDGIGTLRDAEGNPATLSVPLSEATEVELALNPQSGPVLRLRHRIDHLALERREGRMAELARLTVAARFGAGWIGGCEGDTILTLSAPLSPQADAAAIAALIAAGSAILRDGRGTGAPSAATPEPVVGNDWLRL